jgi:AraC family transcriptional regulator, transcriptional activator of the genes for pyochelin and ferripyochelin receptors
MSLELTDEMLAELWDEAERNGQTGWQDTFPDEIDWATLPRLGKSWSCYTPLAQGMAIELQEQELWVDQRFTNAPGEGTGAGIVFNLSGRVQTHFQGLTDEVEEEVGYYHFENRWGLVETELWQVGEPFRRLYLSFDPAQVLGDLDSEQMDQLPFELRQTLEENHRPYYRSHVITPEMNRVIQQIIYCPATGWLKRLYLQGKAYELMMLALAPFQPEPSRLEMPLKPGVVERVHHARAILLSRLDEPLTLMELARQVGLNEFSLKQGFKRVFDTTVFRYLHDYRLDLARRLLVEEDLRIEEVAQRVGLVNRGYFAAAFRKKFGENPKAYQRKYKKSGS